jgi:hypothetical protein
VRHPLTIIAVIGMLGLVMLSISGSFYAGKVGGAEKVGELREEISVIYGSHMVDPEDLEVKVEVYEEKTGLRIAYALKPMLAKNEPLLRKHIRRLTDHVLGNRYWAKRAEFVHLAIKLPSGRVQDERRFREPLPEPAGKS